MSSETPSNKASLPRVLGPVEAFCVVVGSVIGSGIFIVPAEVARDVPFLGPIVLTWVIGGIFSAAGALTLAELGAMLPRAGGPYVYLREAYGPLPAFLFGWTEFLIVRAGSMATLAAAFARYFVQLVPAPGSIRNEVWQAAAAVIAISVVTLINILSTKLGGKLQVAGTALKMGGVLALIALPWIVGGGDSSHLSPVWPTAFEPKLMSGMMAAMVGILWAYDGWINVTPLAEEVREPEKNIPRALIFGMGVLIVLYISMTLAYHWVLPLPEIAALGAEKAADKAVAATYCSQLLGAKGVMAISLVVMASTFISLNGNALTGPRAYFAMARDGLFPARICRVHPRFQTPANAVFTQGAWAVALTIIGTALIIAPAPSVNSSLPGPIFAAWTKLNQTPLYTVLYTYVIFGANLFYLLAIASVFVLRYKLPQLHRPYRTWGYPITPLVYVIAAVTLLGNMLLQTPAESFAGLAIIALGLPAYWVFSRKLRDSAKMVPAEV
ncbi:APC family permease [Singulisphaera sp. PoT]|uniref:APC family permease n=1 Tax=Singulisphaera sp. PoT TaxID=3411797 RepID=UPI003BF5BEA6